MKAAFKYSGGKTKELKHILGIMPDTKSISKIIEPFAGGAALSFHLEKPAVLTDIRENVINCYQKLASDDFSRIQEKIEEWKQMDINEREKLYYFYRDDCFETKDKLLAALRWIFIRQQVFSGMDRCNPKTGKMNAAFGWYKNFTSNISPEHHEFLKKCEIRLQSFEKTISDADEDDFIFLDPPYFERNSDYGNQNNDTASEKLHRNLAASLRATKSKWLLVHSDCELYRELYKDYEIIEHSMMYSQNFKGRNNSNSKVSHLYIKNY